MLTATSFKSTIELFGVIFFISITSLLLPLWSACSTRSESNSAVATRGHEAPFEAEARREAEQYWNSMLTRCGDSYYARDSRGFAGANVFIYQFNDISFNVSAQPLTEADRLNGIEWKGLTSMAVGTSRVCTSRCQAWRNGSVFTDTRQEIRKVNGRWIIGWREGATPPLRKIDCSEAPE